MPPRRAAALAALLPAARAQQTGPGYTYWCAGDCGSDSGASPSGGVVLMGGSTDVDDAFRWMVERSGAGDFLTLRTSGSNGYDGYVRGFGAHSAASLLLTRQGSDSDFVVDKIDRAEAVWFAGGDQSTYVQWWNGTRVADAVQRAVDRGAVVGGTSAGCALLGRTVYTANTGSVTSSEALRDPYDRRIDLGVGFVDYPQAPRGGVTDQHFRARDRFGRMLAFMARRYNGETRGIGVDERTALAVLPSGVGSALGSGVVYVASGGDPARVSPGSPLTYRGVDVTCLRARNGGQYDFAAWRPEGGGSGRAWTQYSVDVVDGVLRGSDGGDVYCADTYGFASAPLLGNASAPTPASL